MSWCLSGVNSVPEARQLNIGGVSTIAPIFFVATWQKHSVSGRVNPNIASGILAAGPGGAGGTR